jgi:hypothetical protein
VILQEWVIEAVAMRGLAGLVVTVTVLGGDASVVHGVNLVVAGLLPAFAIVTRSRALARRSSGSRSVRWY